GSSQTYSVVGTNAQGCQATAAVQVQVNPNPNVTAAAPSSMCSGETATLLANGALSYQWISNSGYIQTNPAYVTPMQGTATYTLIGTDANGCQGTNVVSFVVDACLGINNISGTAGVRVYPNPTSGALTVESGSIIGNVEVTDIAGRVIMSVTSQSNRTEISLS